MGNCPFCGRNTFHERIITETSNFFVIATLGQITDGGYTLIFPKEHHRCLASMEGIKGEFLNLLLYVCKSMALEYGIFPLVFEHGVVGQTVPHAHAHLVPTSVDFTPKVLKDFPQSRHDLYEDAICFAPHSIALPFFQPYLLWQPSPELKGIGRTHRLLNPQSVPAQYFRTILAGALKRIERANWRTMDPELDKRLWSETVERLKKYF